MAFKAQATDDVFSIVDSMPKFPGGNAAIAKYIQMNMNIPPEVREGSKAEKTFVKFIVDTNGKTIDPIAIKQSNYKAFDNEAIRLISKMPAWTAGMDKNKKVKVYMILPISYKDLGLTRIEPQPISKEHENAMANYYAGVKLDEQEKYQMALEKFDLALTSEPENKFALYDKAKMHLFLGDRLKACETWNNMISKNIRKEEAEEEIKKNCNAENINKPIDVAAEKEKRDKKKKAIEFFNIGMTQVNQDRYEAALNSFNKSLEYEPNYSNALYNKAAMHMKFGNKTKACEVWNKMILLNEKDSEVKELIKKNCN
ncbi:MAG: energy transducer TonB [Bacteroidia bacterium]